jgi:hypothetical protein
MPPISANINVSRLSRRSLLAWLGSGAAGLAFSGQARAQVALQAARPLPSFTGPDANPYWNGVNPFVSYPQKLPLLRITDRGVQLETPRPYFLTPFTPNAAFYVRYHLDLIPNAIDLRTPGSTPGGPRGQARSCSTSPRTPGSTCSRLTRGLTVLSRARVGAHHKRGGDGRDGTTADRGRWNDELAHRARHLGHGSQT